MLRMCGTHFMTRMYPAYMTTSIKLSHLIGEKQLRLTLVLFYFTVIYKYIQYIHLDVTQLLNELRNLNNIENIETK